MKQYKKWCRAAPNFHEKPVPKLNKKRCLKTIAKKSKKNQKWPQNRSQKMNLFQGWRLLGHLWSPKPPWGIKSWPPALPKCFQWSKNQPNMTPKSPRLRKRAPEFNLFRNLARRTARSAYNNSTKNPNHFRNIFYGRANSAEIMYFRNTGKMRAETSCRSVLSLFQNLEHETISIKIMKIKFGNFPSSEL